MRIEKGRLWTRYNKIQQAEPTERVSNLDGSLYAVLFNANQGIHSRNLALVYHSLIDAGVSDANISVLEGEGITQNIFVDKPATIKSLDSVVDSIRQKATPNDRLLVYVTNYGSIVNGQCKVEAYGGTIWEKDFEQIMQNLPINFGLFYFGQCSSKGFAERMGYGRNIGISNVLREEEALGQRGTGLVKSIGSHFTHYLFPKILKKGITIEQGFDSAVKKTSIFRFLLDPINHNLSDEIPQLRWQNADPSQLYLGFPPSSKKWRS